MRAPAPAALVAVLVLLPPLAVAAPITSQLWTFEDDGAFTRPLAAKLLVDIDGNPFGVPTAEVSEGAGPFSGAVVNTRSGLALERFGSLFFSIPNADVATLQKVLSVRVDFIGEPDALFVAAFTGEFPVFDHFVPLGDPRVTTIREGKGFFRRFRQDFTLSSCPDSESVEVRRGDPLAVSQLVVSEVSLSTRCAVPVPEPSLFMMWVAGMIVCARYVRSRKHNARHRRRRPPAKACRRP